MCRIIAHLAVQRNREFKKIPAGIVRFLQEQTWLQVYDKAYADKSVGGPLGRSNRCDIALIHQNG